jgi:diguanylate cyclase (GGDEF)-like protein
MTETHLLPLASIKNALSWFRTDFDQRLVTPLAGEFPNRVLPSEVRTLRLQLEELDRYFAGLLTSFQPFTPRDVKEFMTTLRSRLERHQPEGETVPPAVLKTVFVEYRKHLATETERHAAKTFNRELLSTIRKELIQFDALVNSPWFVAFDSKSMPALKDYLSVQRIEALSSDEMLAPRVYDEKFHILLGPTLFFSDLSYHRKKCADRGTMLAIAFLDIDNFKNLNRVHTETKVDTDLLPVFMQTVEAHCYHHGLAYRQGGDEYLVLVPSVSRELAIFFFEELRKKIAALTYWGIPEKTTVSIGLCVAAAGCPFTDRELLGRANQAKTFANENGKDCIATYRSERLDPNEREVVRFG